MTAIAQPQHLQRRRFFSRPTNDNGFVGWLSTVDHKKIGILYGATAIVFFVVGGIEALLIRLQLAQPDGQVLTADMYNQIFTMHGVTMIFLALMPLGAAFFNYLLPLMIGARDVAFPRLNAFSYWVFLFGGLFLYSSIFFSGMPHGAWVGYAPFSVVGPDPGGYGFISAETAHSVHQSRMLFYSLGLQITGIASLASAVNFIVTTLNMRAPGMTLMRMPVFAWMTFVVAFLLLFAMPVIGVALWQLMFSLRWGTPFFHDGGEPLLWQHMFWLFGHPEVYILILPAMGIVSEVLPTFARKPLFGYTAIVFSGIAIGFMGWGVWAHHMFTAGLGPVANAAFGLSTMFIAVPTGIKIFNWLGTLWGGQLRFKTPMLFAIGFIAMFTIGGLSGVMHAIVPHDAQQHDSYFVVAHFHYVLFGGALLGLYAGVYYWFPKVTGRLMNEGLGKWHFWLNIIGFNLTFFPMHILGLNGMPRRYYTYPDGMGWNFWNFVETIGAFLIALATLIFLVNLVRSVRGGEPAGPDPWDARTVEWMTSSPPPPHNFDDVPTISSRDELWHRKYAADDDSAHPVRVPSGGSGEQELTAAGVSDEPAEHGHGIHMPSPSYYPTIAALGLPVAAYGVFTEGLAMVLLLGIGGLLTFGGLFGWALEPSAE